MRLIDADALMAQLEDRQAVLVKEWGYRDHYTRGFEEAADKIGNAPSVDAVEVVHGWWDKYEDDKFIGYDANGRIQYRKVYTYYCGRCGRGTAVKTNYCPNCGADMRERRDNG